MSAGQFANPGDAQVREFMLRGLTPQGNTSAHTNLFLDGADKLVMPQKTTWVGDVWIVAYSDQGAAETWHFFLNAFADVSQNVGPGTFGPGRIGVSSPGDFRWLPFNSTDPSLGGDVAALSNEFVASDGCADCSSNWDVGILEDRASHAISIFGYNFANPSVPLAGEIRWTAYVHVLQLTFP